MSKLEHIFLVGASRGVGREIARVLREKQMPVTALLRSDATQAELENLGVTVKIGDALNIRDLERAMPVSQPVDAVISTIGGLSRDGIRSDYLGNKNQIDIAVKAGVRKFILISSIGSGSSAVALPPQALQALAAALVEKEQAENYLIASGLTYTVIRPGGLKSEPATGRGILTEDHRISGTIHRPDVAQLVYKCLISDRADRKIFSALDRDAIYGDSAFEEFILD